jgi:hypothetical protein
MVEVDVGAAIFGQRESQTDFLVPECVPLTGAGCTRKVTFWCTAASFHQTWAELGHRLPGFDATALTKAHAVIIFGHADEY